MSKKQETVEEKQVAVAQTTAVTTAEEPKHGYGAADDIGAKDIKIERILLTQSMSKKVQTDEVGKGKLIIQSTLEELAGHKEKTEMEFIAIKAMRYWVESDKDTKEFITRYPALDPDELPWEEQRGARTVKRTYTHSFIVLLPKKIEQMEDLPMELAFRSTNLDCAKAINTILLNMKRKQLSSWMKVFKLKIDTKSKGENTWYVTVPTISRDASKDEIMSAEQWAKILTTAKMKLDEGDDFGAGESSNLPPLNQEQVDY
jgi:hypothetical protein